MVEKLPAVETTELPMSPAAQAAIHEIAHAPYVSNLRHFNGRTLIGMVRRGEITVGEMDSIRSEREARQSLLTTPRDVIPEDVPEAALHSEMPWTPSSVLDQHPPTEREYDWAERAAGEAVVRRDQ